METQAKEQEKEKLEVRCGACKEVVAEESPHQLKVCVQNLQKLLPLKELCVKAEVALRLAHRFMKSEKSLVPAHPVKLRIITEGIRLLKEVNGEIDDSDPNIHFPM